MFSLINLVGLAVGLTASILILLYVYNELSYDKFHENADGIYRMNVIFEQKDTEGMNAVGTAAMGVSLREEFPEVVDMVRFTLNDAVDIKYDEKEYFVDKIKYADSTLFKMFSFRLLQGDPETALKEPFSIVITPDEARKIFKEENPIGKFVSLNNEYTLKVTGVVEPPPANSQLQFNGLISFSTLYEYDNIYLDWDGGHGYYTYVQFQPGFDPSSLQERLKPFMQKHINYKLNKVGVNLRMKFEPLKHIHLYSKAEADLETKGDLSNIYTFSAIAIFILLIACTNFMNLSTARSSKRSREVGVRKVMGATAGKLRQQFLAESILISFFAMIVALIIVELIQPVFNNLVGKDLNLYTESNRLLLIGIVVLIFLVGLISGSYPAFYLSSFRPVEVLKGSFISAKGKSVFRDILVVFQFAITIALIICTIVIYRQIHYMKNKELGFEKEKVIYLSFKNSSSKEKVDLLRNEISNLAGVKSAGATSRIPGLGLSMNGYIPDGYKEPMMFKVLAIDENLLETLGIELLQGENFSEKSQLDDNEYIVNQVLINELGWDKPIGRIIYRNGKHKIIGVVNDFHFAPLHLEISPLVITNKPFDGFSYLMIRLEKGDPSSYLAGIESVWKSVLPSETFNYNFLDTSLDRVYKQERHFGSLFIYFSALAILIACLGLLGLASFMVEQRTKEIGIRKVFGSSEVLIMRLLSWGFLKRVLFANIIAWPVAWITMNYWLQNFAYSSGLAWWIFLVSGVLALLLALLTVSYQSMKAASTNPAQIVKYE